MYSKCKKLCTGNKPILHHNIYVLLLLRGSLTFLDTSSQTSWLSVAMAGGKAAISLSANPNRRNPWQWNSGRGRSLMYDILSSIRVDVDGYNSIPK